MKELIDLLIFFQHRLLVTDVILRWHSAVIIKTEFYKEDD